MNVIVGAPNTGKSTWLRLIDYLFGDDDPPAKALKRKVADKYAAAELELTIDDRQVLISRNWQEGGGRGKVVFDGVTVAVDDFSDVFLEAAGLPQLRIPKGNPYSATKWPRLSWRLLLRHIYRQESSWSDIADKQPPADQHAALMVFLGDASRLFPAEYGKLIDAQRTKIQLEARKEQFISTLEDISHELLSLQDASVSLTEIGLDRAQERLREQLNSAQARRQSLVEAAQDLATEKLEAEPSDAGLYDQIARELVDLRGERERVSSEQIKGRTRLNELDQHRRRVAEQVGKFLRLRASNEVLSNLRVSHCPNCDQSVERRVSAGQCHVCLQEMPSQADERRENERRLQFEEQQLHSEASELDELIQSLASEDRELGRSLRDLDDRISESERRLRPARQVIAWAIPPDVALLDQEQGRLAEQVRQLDRIRAILGRREELAGQIDELAKQIAVLDAEVRSKAATVRLSRGEERLETGMNDYLNALNSAEKGVRWQSKSIDVRITDHAVRFLIGGRDWREDVGGTYTCYFLAAYNYALLALSGQDGTAYPGFGMIDLPPNLSDIKLLTNEETYLVEPFVTLLNRKENSGTQLLITGHAYAGLAGVNRIDLTDIFATQDEDIQAAE